ncbi:MAG: GTP-binding protein [Lachnospiraceae bacterium]|nr:GTP-binding protein [Lachnospiraceae bacterium]
MTKIDVISGFLGAGKTTLISKLLKEALTGEQVVLIENEFGEIGIDGGFLKEAGVEIKEMNSGCICCTLVGDFEASLKEVLSKYHPDRIIIEPSGVGKLSDVIVAVNNAVAGTDAVLGSPVTVVDAMKCKMYMKNFGEFFNNQIETAKAVILSRTGKCSEAKLAEAVALIRSLNENADLITTDWEKISGAQILETMENAEKFEEAALRELLEEHLKEAEEHEHEHHHHHHGHDHDEDEHEHHHHHHDDDDDDEHEHHHHHHDDDDDDEHEHHHHHHEHGEHHHHHHHGHHHADDVFTSWGFETTRSFTKEEISDILAKLGDGETFGTVLRAKGMVPQTGSDRWIHFDMVPEETEVRDGAPDVTGKLCVIGADIHTDKLAEVFGKKA